MNYIKILLILLAGGLIFIIGSEIYFELKPEAEIIPMPTTTPTRTSIAEQNFLYNQIYILGGSQAVGNFSDKILQYDQIKDSYAPYGKLPSPRVRSAGSYNSKNGRIYLFGGFNGNTLSDILEFQVQGSISNIGSLPFPLQTAAAAYSVNTNSTFIFGGNTGSKISSTILEYDHNKGSILEIGQLPEAMEGTQSVYYPENGKIYIVGGENEIKRKWFDTVYEFDPSTKDLSLKAQKLPFGLSGSTISYCPATKKIYIFGGVTNQQRNSDKILEYDLLNNATETKNSKLPSARHFGGQMSFCDPIKNKVYIFGGIDDKLNVLDEVLEYDPVNDSIQQKNNLPLPLRGSIIIFASTPI